MSLLAPSLLASRSRSFSRLLLVLLLAFAAHAASASDWTRFRGPTQTGVAAPGSASDWPANPALEVVWKVDLGPGYSSLVAMDGTVYTAWAEGESDWLGAFDAATGERKWTLSLGDRYAGHDGSHDGPIGTPVVARIGERGMVYGLGGHGRLVAASIDGRQVWSVELSEMGAAPFYGFSASPLVVQRDGKSVLVKEVASGEGPTVVGFDALSGEVLWQKGDDEVHYQSPVAVTIGGVDQVVASGIRNLYGLDALSGEILWSHEYGGEPRAMGSASNVPLHLGGGRLLVKPEMQSSTVMAVSHGTDGWSVEPQWSSKDLSRSYVPAVAQGGHVFGYKRGFLVAVDAGSGETVWTSRPPGDGFLAVADGYLVVATKKGSLHLASASADGWNELASLDLFDHPEKDNAVWSDPIVADGDIFVRSMSHLARVGVRDAADDLGAQTADAGRGAEPPAGVFTRFLTSLELYADTPADKASAVDAFLAEQTKEGRLPLVENGHVIFLFRTEEDNAGIEGAMLGERTQGEMRRVPGTDLYYFAAPLPSDAWVHYSFVPGFGDAVVDPLNDRQVQVMGQAGPETFSYVTMPDWKPADYVTTEPVAEQRIAHHDFALSPPDDEPKPEGSEDQTDETWPTSRGIDIVLPEDFDAESGTTYPVVFVFGTDWIREPLALDRALAHYVGDSLPDAVVVLVGSHDTRPMFDVFGGSEAAADSFFEQVVPYVIETYPVAAEGPDHTYVSVNMLATHALEMGLDPRSRAGRLALIQPFFLDSQRHAFAETAKAKTEHRPSLYFDVSPLTLRADHEGWNAADQTRKLASTLREMGYEVEVDSSNLAFVLDALRPRVGTALAFALTGKAEVP